MVLYPNPGFPIYESQIEYLGGTGLPYRYVPTEDGFAIDLDQVRSMITPNTVAIIYNDLQNRISAESTAAEREAIAALAQKHNLWVLSDEAYFEMRYEGETTSIATIPGMAERSDPLANRRRLRLADFDDRIVARNSQVGSTGPHLVIQRIRDAYAGRLV